MVTGTGWCPGTGWCQAFVFHLPDGTGWCQAFVFHLPSRGRVPVRGTGAKRDGSTGWCQAFVFTFPVDWRVRPTFFGRRLPGRQDGEEFLEHFFAAAARYRAMSVHRRIVNLLASAVDQVDDLPLCRRLVISEGGRDRAHLGRENLEPSPFGIEQANPCTRLQLPSQQLLDGSR